MKVRNGTLSVIIPAYNEEDNILNILDILDNQTLTGFDVIIVDDGSKDRTVSLVEKYQPSAFELTLIQQKNMGAALARENGLTVSKGRFIAFVDCDDALDNRSLEETITPMLGRSDLDISLFNLWYVKDLKDDEPTVFNYYTRVPVVSGREALKNCISSWGLHGFGIYKRELVEQAYTLYYQLNAEKTNFLNNDEVISRICFGLANKINMSSGKYYFVHNLQSTTRKINKDYYKVINNAFYLQSFLTSFKDSSSFSYVTESDRLIVSTLWGVFVRYIKWKKFFGKDVCYLWRKSISNGLFLIKINNKKKATNLKAKSRMQLIIINLLLKIL
ncbi:glycosyltransferase family 2 protein [Enterobacter ludwigii]